MADEKKTEETKAAEGTGAPSDTKDTPKPEEKAEATAPARRTRAKGAGEYVVIADQIPLKSGSGKDATFTTHKRGSKVKLTAEQAAKLTGGTRPTVVAASEVKDGNVAGAAFAVWREAATERAKRRRR